MFHIKKKLMSIVAFLALSLTHLAFAATGNFFNVSERLCFLAQKTLKLMHCGLNGVMLLCINDHCN